MSKLIFRSALIGALLITVTAFSQSKKEFIREVRKFQNELNTEYRDSASSPLRGENLVKFKKHPFFPIDAKYKVDARVELISNPETIDFPTSSGRVKKYKAYAYVYFKLDGKDYKLTVFQSPDLMQKDEYKDYLFLPFRDLTNGNQTYGGGKYLDLRIPKTDHLVLDFNLSYQPYCAYNALDYSCPIVPEENRLPVEIKAGVMYDNVYY